MDNSYRIELRSLADLLSALDPADKESLVAAGARLEKALDLNRPEHRQRIEDALGLLQGIYENSCEDALGQLAKLAAELREMEHDEEYQSPAKSSECLCADEIAGMLLGLTGDDAEELGRIVKSVEKICNGPLSSPAKDEALRSLEALNSAIKASEPNAVSEFLNQAAEAIAAVASICEQARLDNQSSDPADAPDDEQTSVDKECSATRGNDDNKSAPAPEGPKPPQQTSPSVDLGSRTLPADIDAELLKEYMVESLDHLLGAQTALLDLENDPDAAEPINVVFRAFHTIKGTSGFLGLDIIQKVAHLAENLLDRARDGEIKITGGYADLSLRACDALKFMIEELDAVSAGEELKIVDDLDDLIALLSDPEAAGVSDEDCSPEMRLGDILVGRGAASRDLVEQAAQSQQSSRIGKVLIEKEAASAANVASALRVQKTIKGSSGAEHTIRVGTDRLDSLINMVGELVIAQSMVAQDPHVTSNDRPRLTRSVLHAGKIVRELQDLSMSLRMVPLKPTFQKLARLVRDLARKSDKNVRLVTEGEDTEIDRNMVEVINDPLVHMIRNAVDHGIEPVETRAAAGKDPTGTIVLRAYQAAGSVVLELVDDGKGLDRDKIMAKAVERGLISEGDDPADSEVFGLIFSPGFSTAETVTDVSGRGVGMDVVRKNIEKLRGRIEVTSTVGAGSTFAIRLPLTMAITDAMMLRLGNERYLLPTVSIEHSFRPAKDSVSTVIGRGEMVMLREELLPLFRLAELFNVSGAVTEPSEGLMVVIEGGGKRCALMVDELLGQQQVVIKHLGESLGKIPGVSGGAILGDGRVGLILDSTGLIALANGDNTQAAA